MLQHWPQPHSQQQWQGAIHDGEGNEQQAMTLLANSFINSCTVKTRHKIKSETWQLQTLMLTAMPLSIVFKSHPLDLLWAMLHCQHCTSGMSLGYLIAFGNAILWHGSSILWLDAAMKSVTEDTAGDDLNTNAQVSVPGLGLDAVLSTESFVVCLAATLSHCQVVASIASTQGVESCSAVTGAAAYDCPLAAAATNCAWHSNPVGTYAFQALIGIAEVPRNHIQVRLPQGIDLQGHPMG